MARNFGLEAKKVKITLRMADNYQERDKLHEQLGNAMFSLMNAASIFCRIEGEEAKESEAYDLISTAIDTVDEAMKITPAGIIVEHSDA
jgi:hypothetical protein